jgi:hypothetical protein
MGDITSPFPYACSVPGGASRESLPATLRKSRPIMRVTCFQKNWRQNVENAMWGGRHTPWDTHDALCHPRLYCRA